MQGDAGRDVAGDFTELDVQTLETLLRKVLCNIEEKIVPRIGQ